MCVLVSRYTFCLILLFTKLYNLLKAKHVYLYQIYVYVCMYVCMYVCVCVCVRACVRARARACVLLFSLKQYTYTIIISKTSIRIIAVQHIPKWTNVYILYCDYVLCIRPKIKYMFCSVLLIKYGMLLVVKTHYFQWCDYLILPLGICSTERFEMDEHTSSA